MSYSREIRRILLGTLAFLALIGMSATYWAIAGQQTLLLREDNPRLIEALASIQRGGIYDRQNRLLAETFADNGGLERRYLKPSTYSAVGYYSLRYGVSGAESAFDDALVGSSAVESLEDYFNNEVLRIPQTGYDVRLTLDADIQDALVVAMGDIRGAAVVLNARSGEVLALVSLPSYNPNTLDVDWSELVEAEGNPFFNRALQGHYQLGGSMYTVLLAKAIESNFDLARRFNNANQPVNLGDDMQVACVTEPEKGDLSLIDAYVYGCPAPFVAYLQTEPESRIDQIIAPYSFENPFTLAGFPLPEEIDQLASPGSEALDPTIRKLRDALGQGSMTTTPLHLAVLTAAIANGGSTSAPSMLTALRPPNTSDWHEQPVNSSLIPMFSPEIASALRAAMRESWTRLRGESGSDDGDVGVHIALSQSGEGTQIWLYGFDSNPDGSPVAFLVVLEDTDDTPALIAIGEALIRAISKAT